MGVIKIELTDEWARTLRELKRQADFDGVSLSGRITIEDEDHKIEIEL